MECHWIDAFTDIAFSINLTRSQPIPDPATLTPLTPEVISKQVGPRAPPSRQISAHLACMRTI